MDKVVVITGASGGLGKAIADLYRAGGDRVCGLSRSACDEEKDEYRCDVTDEAQVNAAVEKIAAKYGCIDVVINNAGAGMFGTAELALARGAGEGRSDAVISVLAANRALGLQGRTASVRGALCGILGGADLRLAEVGEMARYIGEQLSPGTAVHLSTVLDEALEGRLEVVLFLFHEWEPMVPDAPAEPLPAPAAAASAPAVSHGTHAFPDDAAWPVSGGGPSDTARELIAQDGKRIQGRFDQTAPIYYRSQQLDEPTWRRRRLSIDFR